MDRTQPVRPPPSALPPSAAAGSWARQPHSSLSATRGDHSDPAIARLLHATQSRQADGTEEGARGEGRGQGPTYIHTCIHTIEGGEGNE